MTVERDCAHCLLYEVVEFAVEAANRCRGDDCVKLHRLAGKKVIPPSRPPVRGDVSAVVVEHGRTVDAACDSAARPVGCHTPGATVAAMTELAETFVGRR